ncbi:MAG TPA: PQQ-dependent sugar dehydrogenase [Pyrinomonadaceae bacterium]|jgi:glucose/arabinose dehydrogenase
MNKRACGVLFSFITLLTISLFLGRVGAGNPVPAVQQAPAAVELEPVIAGLANPVFVTSALDGTNRLFIVERGGLIKVLQPGSSSPTVFLNITSRVLSQGGEQGLLGLAFHPQFSVNRRFFVNYTRQTDGATVIAEYRVSVSNPNLASTAEIPLLTIAQPFPNHNGGMMAFGRDGYLYIATGDGGSANDPGNRAQNINELLGKILRIDVDHPAGAANYSSPAGNPFFGATNGRDEIYAYGFRNPWRFSFDRGTGSLYVGDVGQGAREEIDIVTLGGNYGWRIFEGTQCTGLGPASCTAAGFTPPISEYGHTLGRCSITGGYVYRGARSTLPTGAYVYADFCTGEIFTLQNGAQNLLLDASRNISSFGEDEAGEIYVVGLGGTVERLRDSQAFPPCEYSLSPVSQSFTASGGTGTVVLTTGGDCNWIAASNVDWIDITSSTSGTGSASIHYSIAANTGASTRTGKIHVGGKTLNITQASQSASPTLSSIRLSASTVPGCKSLTGTVTLNTPAPAGGVVVTLSDNLAATRLPASVTVPAGAATRTFTITTIPVTSAQTGSVTAKLGATTRSAALKVRPIGVQSLALSPNPVVGPNPVTGTVTLECPAPASGINVTLSSSNPAVAAPATSSISIPAGATSKTFTIRTVDVPTSRTAIIKATANGITKSVTLTIN